MKICNAINKKIRYVKCILLRRYSVTHSFLMQSLFQAQTYHLSLVDFSLFINSNQEYLSVDGC